MSNAGNRTGMLIVISGFSGAGKGTLMKRLMSDYDCYALSISATTRQPREGEVHGVHYFYKTREEFEKMIAEGELLEYAQYVENYYGTPKAYVDQKRSEGMDVILEIEIQGAMNIKKQYPDALLIFVTPPSAAELKKRLVGRGTETEEVINKRMKRASEESEGVEAYDYILINDDLDEAVKELHSLIQSQHMKAKEQAPLIGEIRTELAAMFA